MRIASAVCAQFLGAAVLSWQVPAAAAGPAIDQFEIKEPSAEPGRVERQIINDISAGNPPRAMAVGSFDDNTVTRERHGFEFELGVSRYLKTRLGLEFDKDRTDDPASALEANAYAPLQLTEVGLETVLVLSRETGASPGIGLLTEVNHAMGPEASTLVFGPLLQVSRPAWSATLNLTFTRFFGGTGEGTHDDKWDFSYAAQLKVNLAKDVDLALEGYGTFERIAASGTRGEASRLFGDHDQHRLGAILYVGGLGGKASGAETTFGLGVLVGLNSSTPDATVKLDLETEF